MPDRRRRHALALAKLASCTAGFLSRLAQTNCQSRSAKREALAAAGPCTQHREVVHRLVDEIILGPEIVAADQRVAAVDQR